MVRTLPTVAVLATTLLLGGCAAGTTTAVTGEPDTVTVPTETSTTGAVTALPHDELPEVSGGRES